MNPVVVTHQVALENAWLLLKTRSLRLMIAMQEIEVSEQATKRGNISSHIGCSQAISLLSGILGSLLKCILGRQHDDRIKGSPSQIPMWKNSKRVKRYAKKSTTPTVGVVIRYTPGVSVSKKKALVKADRGKGIELLSDAALLEDTQLKKYLKKSRKETHKLQASGSSEGANFDIRGSVLDVSKADSFDIDDKSWGNSEDESDDVNDDGLGNIDDRW
ncbi:hypothetical protein Tco_0871034 [Tanacetum coccineum]